MYFSITGKFSDKHVSIWKMAIKTQQ